MILLPDESDSAKQNLNWSMDRGEGKHLHTITGKCDMLVLILSIHIS